MPQATARQEISDQSVDVVQTSIIPEKKMRRGERAATVLLLIVALFVLGVRHSYVLSHYYPTSTDGFYYLVEIETWANEGHSYYGRFSPVAALLGLFSRLLGIPSPVLYQGAVLVSLWTSSITLLLIARARSELLGVVLFVFLWGSEILFYRHYAFLNQGLSVSLAYLAAYVLQRVQGIVRFPLSISLALGAASIHPFGGATALILLSAEAIRKRGAMLWVLPLVATFVLVAVFRVEREIIEVPRSLVPSWIQACQDLHCSWREWGEFLLITSSVLLLLGMSEKSCSSYSISLLALFLLLNVPLWSTEGHMLHRLAFASVWIALLSIALLPKRERFGIAPIVVSAVMLIVMMLSAKEYNDTLPSVEPMLRAREVLQRWIPENGVIVAPHGVQFRISYALRRYSTQELPSDTNQPTYVYRRLSPRERCVSLNSIPEEISGNAQCVLLTKRDGIAKME